MDLEYYDLPQAARKVGCEESDIVYFLENNKLEAHLLSKSKKYFVCSRPEGELIGHAVCGYRGLIQLHPSWIQSLLEKKEITVNATLILVELDKIIDWNSKYPYQGILPNEIIHKWEALTQDYIANNKSLLGRPYANELPSGRTQFFRGTAAILNSFARNEVNEEVNEQLDKMNELYSRLPDFGYEETGKFEYQDIRIKHETLVRHFANQFPEASGDESGHTERIENLLTTTKKKRITQHHVPIERVLLHNADRNSRELWQLLKEDVRQAERLYDVEKIIVEMDNNTFKYERLYESTGIFSFPSFSDRISKLRNLHLKSKKKSR